MEQGYNWEGLPSLTSEQVELTSTLRQRLPGLVTENQALLPKPPGCSDLPAVIGITGDWTLPEEQIANYYKRLGIAHPVPEVRGAREKSIWRFCQFYKS